MLHAELHGKLDPDSPALTRREDILTSTVFGTLFAARATDILTEWFNRARQLSVDGRLDSENLGLHPAPVVYWFWPAMVACEPDVVLRIGSVLIVVEAKYGSRKSGSGPAISDSESSELELPVPDQLLRQWTSVRPVSQGIDRYDGALQLAVRECKPHLVYLVPRRSYASALRELKHSQDMICDAIGQAASLWLLTWEDLHATLRNRIEAGEIADRWRVDLARLLEKRGLAAFRGFPRALPPDFRISPAVESWGSLWGWRKKDDLLAVMRGIDLAGLHRSVRVIEVWRESFVVPGGSPAPLRREGRRKE